MEPSNYPSAQVLNSDPDEKEVSTGCPHTLVGIEEDKIALTATDQLLGSLA